MSLVFDSFPDREHAERFAAAVNRVEPELATKVLATVAASDALVIFPFKLTPPIVHVERPYSGHDSDIETAREGGFADDTSTGREREEALELAVIPYLGEYRGT